MSKPEWSPDRFSKTLDTGDSEAIHKDLLKHVVKELIKVYRYRLMRRLEDRVGVYAVVMRDTFGSRLFLIAKGSKLWRGIVSCQARLPNFALSENTPIVLAWLKPPENTLKFYLFDPYTIIHEKEGFNIRRGVQMINFNIRQGIAFDPCFNVQWKFEELKKKRNMKLTVFQ